VSKVDSINSARFYLVRAGRHPGGTASRGTAEERSSGFETLRKHIAIVNNSLCQVQIAKQIAKQIVLRRRMNRIRLVTSQ